MTISDARSIAQSVVCSSTKNAWDVTTNRVSIWKSHDLNNTLNSQILVDLWPETWLTAIIQQFEDADALIVFVRMSWRWRCPFSLCHGNKAQSFRPVFDPLERKFFLIDHTHTPSSAIPLCLGDERLFHCKIPQRLFKRPPPWFVMMTMAVRATAQEFVLKNWNFMPGIGNIQDLDHGHFKIICSQLLWRGQIFMTTLCSKLGGMWPKRAHYMSSNSTLLIHHGAKPLRGKVLKPLMSGRQMMMVCRVLYPASHTNVSALRVEFSSHTTR